MKNNAIVFTITNDYIKALEIFLISYRVHNSYTPDCVVFEEEPITLDAKNIISNVYPKTTFIKLNSNFEYERNFERRKWLINPANRFNIFLLKKYDKIIFFDADMVIVNNIEKLFYIKNEFSAVYHPDPDGIRSNNLCLSCDYSNKINFDFNKTFNAGLMVIGNEYLNEQTANNLFDIYKQKDWLGNQGPLNYYFNSKVNLLNSNYFVSTPFLNKNLYESGIIFHFAGNKKPWFTNSFQLEDNFDKHVIDCNKDRVLLLKLLNKYMKYDNKKLLDDLKW
jgi:lipopolysaccharide biosynthesis glycosyltransferase